MGIILNPWEKIEPLGENIDFGPNDAMGVIVSLTLDDGEEQRPHRENDHIGKIFLRMILKKLELRVVHMKANSKCVSWISRLISRELINNQ